MDSKLMIYRQSQPQVSLEKLVVNPYSTLASVTSGCILVALEYQRLILDAILKIQIAGVLLTHRQRDPTDSPVTESRLSISKILRQNESAKFDLKNPDHFSFVQHAGKGKKGGKKGGKGSTKEEKQNGGGEEKNAQRKREEEERLKKWKDDWEKKLKAQEALDEVPCCSTKGLFLKPRTQSNIWIKVTGDKTTQDVQMAFMHVPVPKPKTPPLPKLVRVEPAEDPPMAKDKKGGKKKEKGKGKKK